MDPTQAAETSDAGSAARLQRRFRLALGGLFPVALALRAGFAWEVSDLPTFRYPVMDAASDLASARAIAAGAWLPRTPFYRAPLYPYFLALSEITTGAAENARIAQVLL